MGWAHSTFEAVFEVHDPRAIAAIELRFSPSEASSELVDEWKSIHWAALDEAAAGFPHLTQLSVAFAAGTYAPRSFVEAAIEELGLWQKIAMLHRAKKLVVQIHSSKGGQRVRTIISPPAQ